MRWRRALGMRAAGGCSIQQVADECRHVRRCPPGSLNSCRRLPGCISLPALMLDTALDRLAVLPRIEILAALVARLVFFHGDAMGVGEGILADACHLPGD